MAGNELQHVSKLQAIVRTWSSKKELLRTVSNISKLGKDLEWRLDSTKSTASKMFDSDLKPLDPVVDPGDTAERSLKPE